MQYNTNLNIEGSTDKLITKGNLELVTDYDINTSEWFISNHQPHLPESFPSVTLRELVNSVLRSEALMQQFPIKARQVKKLVDSLFVKGEELTKPISLAEVDGSLYNIGGRHRTAALVEFLKFIIPLRYVTPSDFSASAELSEEEGIDALGALVNDKFEQALDTTLVRVYPPIQLRDPAEVERQIVADNSSRSMNPAEKSHLRTQSQLGLSPDKAGKSEYRTVATAASQLSKAETVDAYATLFVRKYGQKLARQLGAKPNTLHGLFKKVMTEVTRGPKSDSCLFIGVNGEYLLGSANNASILENYKSIQDLSKCIFENIQTAFERSTDSANFARSLSEVVTYLMVNHSGDYGLNDVVIDNFYVAPVNEESDGDSMEDGTE